MSSEYTRGGFFIRVRESLEKLKREYNAEFHVVFYTAIGRIVCDIEPPAAQGSFLGFVDDPTTFTVDISAVFDGTGMFDEQLINARNVIVYENNSDKEVMRVDQMVLFADKILGFSLVRQQI